MAARVFYLVRIEDETGTSGTGIVAEGAQWSNGDVSVRWLGEFPCVHYWPGGIEHVRKVHGHRGKTKVVWADEDASPGAPAAPPPPLPALGSPPVPAAPPGAAEGT